MSSNSFLNPGFGIGVEFIDVGDLSAFKGPGAAKVADIAERLRENARLVNNLIDTRDEAHRHIFELRETPTPDLAAALWEGRDPDELTEGTAAVVQVIRDYEDAEANAQALINARTTAAGIGRQELDAALTEAAPELAGSALTLAKGIGTRLSAAVQMIERAAAEYEIAFGLGNLLADRAEGSPSLVIQSTPGGPEITLAVAAESVRESLQTWTVRLAALEAALKPVKKGKAPKRAATPAVAPTAPEAAPVGPSNGSEPVAFEMGTNDE